MPGTVGNSLLEGGKLVKHPSFSRAGACTWEPALSGGGCLADVWSWPALPRTGR